MSDERACEPQQQEEPPGLTEDMRPRPDHGEDSYGDSGIGRAIALASPREASFVSGTVLGITGAADAWSAAPVGQVPLSAGTAPRAG